MKKADPRALIPALSALALVCAVPIPWPPLAVLLPAACLLAAVICLYRNLGALSGLTDDHPKVSTLRAVTLFNLALLIFCAVLAALLAAGVLRISENDEKYLAAAVVSAVILFLGNLAPKLPRTRHTGLRLPWTVADEDAWICAHRAVGYVPARLLLRRRRSGDRTNRDADGPRHTAVGRRPRRALLPRVPAEIPEKIGRARGRGK